MTSDVIVVIYVRWGLMIFLEPLSTYSGRLSYIFFITVHPVTFISVDDPTFFNIGSWSLGVTRRFLMVTPSLKWACTPYLLHVLFRLSLSLGNMHHYVWFLIVLLVVCIMCGALILACCSHLDNNCFLPMQGTCILSIL